MLTATSISGNVTVADTLKGWGQLLLLMEARITNNSTRLPSKREGPGDIPPGPFFVLIPLGFLGQEQQDTI